MQNDLRGPAQAGPRSLRAVAPGYSSSVNDDSKCDDEELERQRAELLPEREAMSLINPVLGDMPTDSPLTPMPGKLPPVEDTQ